MYVNFTSVTTPFVIFYGRNCTKYKEVFTFQCFGNKHQQQEMRHLKALGTSQPEGAGNGGLTSLGHITNILCENSEGN